MVTTVFEELLVGQYLLGNSHGYEGTKGNKQVRQNLNRNLNFTNKVVSTSQKLLLSGLVIKNRLYAKKVGTYIFILVRLNNSI